MTFEKLRRICIKNGWFTAGTNEQYEKLFKLADEGAPVQDLALVIWVCSVDWEWLDIVKTLEAEESTTTPNTDHMAIPAKEALRLWSGWDYPDNFNVEIADCTGWVLSKQKMTAKEFMDSPLADRAVRSFGTTRRNEDGTWLHHITVYEERGAQREAS